MAIEILPEDKWKSDSAKLPGGGKGGKQSSAAAGGAAEQDGEEGEEGEEGEALGAEVCQVAPGEHYADDGPLATEGGGTGHEGSKGRPTGVVVGVVKRNWRARGYCGSLKPPDRALHGASSVLFMPVERRFPMIRCVGGHSRPEGARGTSRGNPTKGLPLTS